MKRHALVVGIAILGALQMVAPPANASASIKDNLWSDAPVPAATSSTFSGAVTSGSMTCPSSISLVASTSGATSIAGTNTLGLDDSTDAMFTLPATTATPTVNFFTDGTGCATAGACTARGTITLTFSAPVLNPVLHLTSLSGWAGRWPGGPGNFLATTDASLIHPKWTLINASPAGATIGAPSAGATNLATTSTTIDVVDPRLSTFCNTVIDPPTAATATSGCGSVSPTGIVTSLTFDIEFFYVIDKGAGWNGSASFSSFPPGDICGLVSSSDALQTPTVTLVKEVCTNGTTCDRHSVSASSRWAPTYTIVSDGAVQWRIIATNTGTELVNGVVLGPAVPDCALAIPTLPVGVSSVTAFMSTGLAANAVDSITATASGARTGQVVDASGSANVAVAASPVDPPIATPSAAPAQTPGREDDTATPAATGGDPAATLGTAILGGLLLGTGIVSLVVQRARTSRRAQLGDTKSDPSGAGE